MTDPLAQTPEGEVAGIIANVAAKASEWHDLPASKKLALLEEVLLTR